MECLVIDNQSSDGTSDAVLAEIRSGGPGFPVHVIRPRANLGYAGSQKLAYALACASPAVRNVIMLHGDGQYPPELLRLYEPYLETDFAIVSGYRSKKAFPQQEETPWGTYAVIKTLNLIESLVTLQWRREWHSGFVMYSTDFLRKVPLRRLSTSCHINGEMLMLAGVRKSRTASVPIYKRYKGHEAFAGAARFRYVLRVFGLMWKYRLGHHRRLLRGPIEPVEDAFDLLA